MVDAATLVKSAKALPRAAVLGLRTLLRPPRERRIWLTFDDGPQPTVTPRILESLSGRGLHATFFAVGQQARRYPDILRAVHRSGHRIGNHTNTHRKLTELEGDAIRREILDAEQILADFLPRHEKLFRPPNGLRNPQVDQIARELGYQTVLWNVSTRDWSPRYQPDKWPRHGRRLIWLEQDALVLLHDSQPSTADRLDVFLDMVADLPNVRFMEPDTLLSARIR